MSEQSRVLIVDDQPENIHVLMQALKDEFAILAALDGEKALRLAQGATPPDVILLDVMMPGLDGYEVCRRLKADERTQDIPVIFVTAKDQAADEALGLELGALDYLVKPVNPALVKARVRNHIALRQAARLREDVDRIMRHDLKAPLTSILGLPQLLLEEPGLPESVRESLQVMEQAGYRMLQMINSSLDLYKMEQGRYVYTPESVDLCEVLRNVAAELRDLIRSRRVELQLLLGGEVPTRDAVFPVQGEPLLCHSLAANLLKNALEAAPRGSPVRVELEHAPEGPCLRIHNHGAIPVEIRGRFFEKYATAGKRGGTGLGAYSARRIAQTMGGEIGFSSSAEEGTTLWVRFRPAGADPAPEQKPQSVAGHRLRVLLADDDQQAVELLTTQLRRLGHEVVAADGGAEALRLFQPGAFDLVLVDKEMPDLDGAEVARSMRATERAAESAPCLLTALTGHDAPQVHDALLGAGFDRVLVKPLTWGFLTGLGAWVSGEGGAGPGDAVGQPAGSVVPEVPDGPLVVTVEADLQDLLPGLLRTLAQELERVPDLLRAGELEALRALGHKRKGTCRAYGLLPLVEPFAALEQAAGHGETAALPELHTRLTGLLERLELRYGDGES